MKNISKGKPVRWNLRQARLSRLYVDVKGGERLMSQADAAREISKKYNVSLGEEYFGMIERGEKTGSIRVMKAIADYFQLEIGEII